MAIRRKCSERFCKQGKRCLEHLQFDVTQNGVRYRMLVNAFAIPRMEPGRQRPIQSMEEAKHWERLFIGELRAGRDPRVTPKPIEQPELDLQHVAGFLDVYFERQVKPAGLRSLPSIRSRIAVLKAHLGELPTKSLEQPEIVNRLRTSTYAKEVTISTLHKVFATLRAAIHWGQAQRPRLIEHSPFHRFGVRMSKKTETSRDRRITRAEEQRLLEAALAMTGPEHKYVGQQLYDRIIGALELCCRRGEMLLIQNKRVDWESHQIGIPGSHREGQGEPTHPVRSRRAPRDDPRTTEGARPGSVRLRYRKRRVSGSDSDGVGDAAAARAWLRAPARSRARRVEPRAAREDRPALARPAPRRRVTPARRRRRHPRHSTHARALEPPADAALPQRDRRGVAPGTGSQLAGATGFKPGEFPARVSPICPQTAGEADFRTKFSPEKLWRNIIV